MKTNKPDTAATSGRVQRLVRSLISWAAARVGCYLVSYKLGAYDFEEWNRLMDKWQTAIANEDESLAKYYEGRVQQCERDEAQFCKHII